MKHFRTKKPLKDTQSIYSPVCEKILTSLSPDVKNASHMGL